MMVSRGIFNLGNSRIFVIASEAKQSLRIPYKKFKGILNSLLCHPPAPLGDLYMEFQNLLRNSRIPLFFWGLGGFFLGILDQEFQILLRNSRIPCVIAREQSDRSQEFQNSLGNSRIFVIASEAKQSLRNSKFILRNSRFLLALVGQAPLLANFLRATP